MWSVVFLNDHVRAELQDQPKDIRAKFERIGPIWEMRMTGRDGIARDGQRTACGSASCFHEEDAKDAASRDRTCSQESGEIVMTRRMIPVEEAFAEWRKDPEYVKAYEALEDEFALAEALLGARARAELTQGQLAKRMGTTQAVIARLESGRSMPSTRTLERLAKATGHKLKISFEPAVEPARVKRRKKAA